MSPRLKNLITKCRPHLLPLLLLCLMTGAVYGRTLGYDFLSNWDDNHYIVENADVQGFGWDRLKVVFSTYYVGNYAPVQMISYMLDYVLWGLNPGGFHLTNLLLHTINGLLLYWLLFRLISHRLAALSGAALFLLHPVQVETVVWISQRKNLLAMTFFLLAWNWYCTYRETAAGRRYWHFASVVSLLLALLSKSVAVIFPVAMLLFDYCYPKENKKPNLQDKLPYILIALLAAILAVFSQTPDPSTGRGGGRTVYHGGGPLATFLTMLPVLVSYLRLVVWPVNLSALYDPPIHTGLDNGVVAAIIFLCVVGLSIFWLSRSDRSIAFWPTFFFLALLPVSQIVPLVTLMNDRYLYFPLLGIAALLAYGVKGAAERWDLRPLNIGFCIMVPLLFWSILSFQRSGVWSTGAKLWSDTVRKNPKLPLAWEALGEANHYTSHPNRVEARKAYLQAIKLCPGSEMSRYNLGVLYMDQNEYDDAEAILKELLQRSPDHVMGLTAYGDLALRRNELEVAEQFYRKALSLQPDAVPINQKIGNLMVVIGRIDEARTAYLQVEKLQWGTNPANAYELARVEALAGDTGGAVKWLETALQRGFSNYDWIMQDEELTPVRMDGRFTELVQKYFPQP